MTTLLIFAGLMVLILGFAYCMTIYMPRILFGRIDKKIEAERSQRWREEFVKRAGSNPRPTHAKPPPPSNPPRIR